MAQQATREKACFQRVAHQYVFTFRITEEVLMPTSCIYRQFMLAHTTPTLGSRKMCITTPSTDDQSTHPHTFLIAANVFTPDQPHTDYRREAGPKVRG